MKRQHDVTPSPIMTVAEVARYLRIHQSTVYRLIHRSQLPYFKTGSDYRFDRDTIEKWMADRQVRGWSQVPKKGRASTSETPARRWL